MDVKRHALALINSINWISVETIYTFSLGNIQHVHPMPKSPWSIF